MPWGFGGRKLYIFFAIYPKNQTMRLQDEVLHACEGTQVTANVNWFGGGQCDTLIADCALGRRR